MKKILITGGAGFIGSNLALKLIEIGHEVVVMDNLSPQIHGQYPEKTSPLYNSIKDKVQFIQADVQSRDDLGSAISNADAIIHLAAETGTGQSMYEIQKYESVNIGGTALLMDILTNKPHKVRKVIVASSRAIYGEGKYHCAEHGFVYPNPRQDQDMIKSDFSCKCPICNKTVNLYATTEDSKIHPTSFYGITKQVQEQMIMLLCPSIGIAPVSLRYQNVYGAGQSLQNPYTGILSIFSTRLKNGNEINIFEDGKESRDFIYIEDVVMATIRALENDNANGEIFNVGSGIPTDVLTIASNLMKALNISTELKVTGNYRLGDIRHNIADIKKIQEKIGFVPRVSLDMGIEKFVAWVNKQEACEDLYEKSIEEMQSRGLYK